MPFTALREPGDTQLDFPRQAASVVGTSGQSLLAPSLDLPASVGECVCVSLRGSGGGEVCVLEGLSAKITEMLH